MKSVNSDGANCVTNESAQAEQGPLVEVINSRNINHALVDVVGKVFETGASITVRDNQGTTEICPLVVNIERPLERCLLNKERKNNTFAAIAESVWVMSGRNDIRFLSNYLPRAVDFSDDKKTWRAGYGARLRDFHGVDQVKEIYRILKNDPSSRRAVAAIFDPTLDFVESKDIPCNNWLHFMIRDGILNLDIAVRSNDAIWGFSAINTFEWSVLLEMMAFWLHCEVGRMTFFASSMHVYNRHSERAQKIIKSEVDDIYERNPKKFRFATRIEDIDEVLAMWFEMEYMIRQQVCDMSERIADFPDPLLRAYLQMIDFYWALDNGTEEGALRRKLEPLKGSDLELVALEYAERKHYNLGQSASTSIKKSETIPKVILVEGADQTGKTTLINELIRQIGEDKSVYIHNVLYDDFIEAHESIRKMVQQIRGKEYVIVDRWHISQIVYGQVFGNGIYDESHWLFSAIDSLIDKVIVCSSENYSFKKDLRAENFDDAKKQIRVNELFREYVSHSGDNRYTLYDYNNANTPEALHKYVFDLIKNLDWNRS